MKYISRVMVCTTWGPEGHYLVNYHLSPGNESTRVPYCWESYCIPALLKCAILVNQPFNRMKLLWAKLILLSGVHSTCDKIIYPLTLLMFTV